MNMFFSYEIPPGYTRMAAVVVAIVVVCAFIQKMFKKDLERDQYYYLRDICMMAAWALCGIWTQSAPMKLAITAGIIAGLVGFCQKVARNWDLRFCYLLIGLGVSILGPRITFIGLPHGEFFYLSGFSSILLSTLWVGLFPILFQALDEIPGMGGCLLLVSWMLLAVVTAISSKGVTEALVMSVCGLALILVFWSRHVNVYRRLGTSLSALWGTLLAGSSMLGASKGVAFSTVMILPLGLFVIPILETSLSVLSAAFSPKPLGSMIIYRKLVVKGIDHPTAVFVVTGLCALCGSAIATLQMGFFDLGSLITALLLIGLGVYIALARTRRQEEQTSARSSLWGVTVDNFSLDYALGRIGAWVSSRDAPRMIVTPDALASLRSRRDKRYCGIIDKASLVLPDGSGLTWALRFLGSPVQKQIPGVEFMEHLCRKAASHGWPVYFLGGKPGVAKLAAGKMSNKYPGLVVSGSRDGYFSSFECENICEEIRNAGTSILFVALGVPKQEYWLEENLEKLPGIVGIGVGGSFDVHSGMLKRAPLRWRKMKLEWLYRTIQEPARWRRAAKLPLFVLLVLLKKLRLDTWQPFI